MRRQTLELAAATQASHHRLGKVCPHFCDSRKRLLDRVSRQRASRPFWRCHTEPNQRMQRTRDAVCGCSFVSVREPLILRVLLLLAGCLRGTCGEPNLPAGEPSPQCGRHARDEVSRHCQSVPQRGYAPEVAGDLSAKIVGPRRDGRSRTSRCTRPLIRIAHSPPPSRSSRPRRVAACSSVNASSRCPNFPAAIMYRTASRSASVSVGER
jgi:hypothetical protein